MRYDNLLRLRAWLWWRSRTSLQHLAMFAGAAVTVGTGIAWFDPGLRSWGAGLGGWALSAWWGVGAHRGVLLPRGAAYLAAVAGLLTGAQLAMEVGAGHLLALGTVAGLLAAGVLLRRVWLLAVGALVVFLVVPSAVRFLPRSHAAPLAIFVAGLILLGVALWLAKWSKASRPGP